MTLTRAGQKQEGTVAESFRSSREVIIRTGSWSEAKKFYGEVLGLPGTLDTDTMAGFETGSFCLYVEKGETHGPVFEFLVPDVPATRDRLVAAGCTVVEEIPSLPRCYVRDPYGVVFNLARSPGR
jgi:predicted enzyme related to lactoylglutathione lyase